MSTLPMKMPRDNDSAPVPVAVGSGQRANLAAVSASTNSTLPAGTYGLVIVRSTDFFWLNFGTSGVTAAASSGSILVAPGEGVYGVPATATHFAGLRAGTTDVAVQLESLATV